MHTVSRHCNEICRYFRGFHRVFGKPDGAARAWENDQGLIEGDEIDGGATERNRQQHVEQATSVHRRQNIGRNLSFLLGAAGSGLDHRRKGAGPRNPILTVLGQQRSPPDVFTSLAQGKPPVGSRWHLGFPSTSIAAAAGRTEKE